MAFAWARQKRSQRRSDLATSAVGVVIFFVVLWIVSLRFRWLTIGPGAFAIVVIPASVLGQNRLAKNVEAANRRRMP